jgi:SAM-dependent MidA family methyltransferase
VYLVSRWQAAGCPSRTRLVELGPGKGTLLADVVRVSPCSATLGVFSG